MAARGQISVSVTGTYGNISGYIAWSESEVNTSANTSKVTATLYYANSSGYTTYSAVASPAFYLTINGNTKSTSSGITVSAYSNGVAAISHSVTVTHDDNGSKSITISGGGGLSGTSDLQNSSGSGTATLTSIVRGKPTVKKFTVSPWSGNSVVNSWRDENDNGYYVKGFTKINYSIQGEIYPGSGATITTYEFQGKGETIRGSSGKTANVIQTAGNISVSGYVKDSRGIWSNADTKTIFVYDYTNPKITSASAYRSDSSGSASASGTHVSVSCSAQVGATIENKNAIESITYVVADNDTGTQKESGTLQSGESKTLNNYPEDHSYLVTFSAVDTAGISVVRTIVVPKAIVTLHLAENGLGVSVGCESTNSNSFEVNPDWDVYIKGEKVNESTRGTLTCSNNNGKIRYYIRNGIVTLIKSDDVSNVQTGSWVSLCSLPYGVSPPASIFVKGGNNIDLTFRVKDGEVSVYNYGSSSITTATNGAFTCTFMLASLFS